MKTLYLIFHKKTVLCKFTIIILLWTLFATLLLNVRELAYTADEPAHIAAGYAYLTCFTTWPAPLHGHPPLLEAWEALFFFIEQPDIPVEQLNGWGENFPLYVKDFVKYLSNNVERSAFVARVPVILLVILLAATILRWAKDLWGTRGGLLALLIMLCDPTLLGHGMLATTDLGVTVLGTLTLFVVWRLRRRANFARLISAGILLGLTLVSKHSSVIWGLAVPLMLLYPTMTSPDQKAKRWRCWIIQNLVIASLALMTIWLVYGFEWQKLPNWPWVMPAPSYWAGLRLQVNAPPARRNFFLGEIYQKGRWDYFPIAFLMKNSPAFVMLLCASSILILRRPILKSLFLWNFPFTYMFLAMQSNANIGYRHLLPLHPFLYILIGKLALAIIKPWQLCQGNRRWISLQTFSSFTLIGLILWQGIDSHHIAPFYTTYFSPFLGGPEQAWRYLADSNTDWGQASKALRVFQEKHNLIFKFSGRQDVIGVDAYDLEYLPIPPQYQVENPRMEPWLYPEPGNYILSANTLSGLGLTYADNYDWFRHQKPNEVIANVFFYYHVPPLPEASWVAQCVSPVAPLDQNTLTRGFGALELRNIPFDCTQSWIYPNGGKEYGWYILHGQLLNPRTLHQRLSLAPVIPTDPFIQEHWGNLTLTYGQWKYGDIPAHAIFQWNSEVLLPQTPPVVFLADAHITPEALQNIKAFPLPVDIDNRLLFIGAEAAQTGEFLTLDTWWQVKAHTMSRPFSIMAHLIRPDGTALDVADGFGILPPVLQTDDIVIQRHQFSVSDRDAELWLRLGAYWLDDITRWPVISMSHADALFVPLRECISKP